MLIQSMIFAMLSASVQCDPTNRNWVANTEVTVASRYWDSLVTLGSYTFNGSMTHAVAIPKNEDESDEFCELIYPLDKLPLASADLANTTHEGECVDEEVAKKMTNVFWLDPRNWFSYYDYPYMTTTNSSEVVPHIERVPCDYDTVTIPNTTSTFIILPPNPVKLTYLMFGNMFLRSTASRRQKQVNNEYFMRHFIAKSSVDLVDMFNITFDITGHEGCKDRTGCTCGTAGYKKEICAFVVDDCPKDLPCIDPITPTGHCCSICGARISIRIDEETFVYRKLEPVVQKFVKTESDKLKYEVDMHMSKVSDYRIQIVILPKNEYSLDLLNDLAEGLVSYLDKRSNLGIQYSYAILSGKAKVDHHLWSIIGIILTSLALALAFGFFLVYAKRQNWFNNTVSFVSGPKSTRIKKDENQHSEYTTKIGEHDANEAYESEKNIEIEPLPDLQPPFNFVDTSD